MDGSMQRPFERWQRTGDPQALAALFDASGASLLRLAIHLVGDASLAEDLVQATFLAAIEQRAEIDATRPLEPWLAAVLTHKARAARRSEARRPDPREMLARAERSPLDEAIAGEFSGELARALDRLREPYRSVLVLRLRHGLAPADIAHALERSPGVIRVQLHRGLEELRRSLPAGVAGVALLVLTAPRGLASVREVVVAAATQSAGWTAATLAGGLIVTKHLVLGGVAAVLLAAWAWFANAPAAAPGPDLHPVVAGEELRPLRPHVPDDRPVAIASPIEPQRVAAHAPTGLPSRLVGRVVDAHTGEGLVGARLRLFSARSGQLSEVAVAQGEEARHGADGRPWTPYQCLPLILSGRGGKKLEHGQESVHAVLGLESVRIYDVPQPSDIATSEATSGPEGDFQLASPVQGGVIVVERDGFAPRCFAAPLPEGRWNVGLLPAWTLSGIVIDQLGEVVRQPLRLAFSPNDDRSVTREVGNDADTTIESVSLAAWTCESRDDGSFSLQVGGQAMRPNVLTPGWVSQNTGIHPETGKAYVFDMQFMPEDADQTAWVVAQGVPLLEVYDASTQLPVEDLMVVSFDNATGYPRTCGRFRAPGGRVTLSINDQSLSQGSIEGRRVLIGSPGYRSAEVLVTDWASAERHVVALVPGEEERIRGSVFEGNRPVADALVTVAPCYRGWGASSSAALDAARTGADGSFEVNGLSGRWVLQVRFEEQLVAHPVEVPAAEVRIDLADPTGFVVKVVDAAGAARADHAVHFFGSHGRSEKCLSDDLGIARIGGLDAGSWQVRTSRVAGDGPKSLDIGTKCELSAGESRELELVVPRLDPDLHYRLVVPSYSSLAGWKARFDVEWTEIASDGTLESPEDGLGMGLEVQAPDGRRWERTIDPRRPVGEFELVPNGPGYAGILRLAGTGEPLTGVRVSAWFPGASYDWHTMSAVTDSQGRFQVQGRPGPGWKLTFEPEDELSGRWRASATYAGLTYCPDAGPADPLTAIDVRLPLRQLSGAGGLESVRVHGRVLSPLGRGLAEHVVLFNCIAPQSDGWLEVDYGSARITTGAEGRFSVDLPATERVDVVVIDVNHKDLLRETWDAAIVADGSERVLRVP